MPASAELLRPAIMSGTVVNFQLHLKHSKVPEPPRQAETIGSRRQATGKHVVNHEITEKALTKGRPLMTVDRSHGLYGLDRDAGSAPSLAAPRLSDYFTCAAAAAAAQDRLAAALARQRQLARSWPQHQRAWSQWA